MVYDFLSINIIFNLIKNPCTHQPKTCSRKRNMLNFGVIFWGHVLGPLTIIVRLAFLIRKTKPSPWQPSASATGLYVMFNNDVFLKEN